jgi:hypothetical protein
MEQQTKRPNSGDPESLRGQRGKGLPPIIQAVFFILCGAIVVIWENFGKIARTVYERGTDYGTELIGSRKGPPQKVRVRVLPIDNYDQLTVEQILSHIGSLSTEELALIKNFEMRQQNRSPVVEAIDKRLAEIG